MIVICVTTTYPFASIIHKRLDEISERVPCVAKFFSVIGEIYIECRAEDAAYCERMIADLV